VTLFRNEKVSKECQNTEASTFGSQMLEGEGDALLKQNSFKGALKY
jgi:hypothetical protein